MHISSKLYCLQISINLRPLSVELVTGVSRQRLRILLILNEMSHQGVPDHTLSDQARHVLSWSGINGMRLPSGIDISLARRCNQTVF